MLSLLASVELATTTLPTKPLINISLLILGVNQQIQDPTNGFQVHERGVSSGDHSFEAHTDGKYIYCFSNEHSSVATKEVSFNVHGIVYVPESEAPSDPLESEGKFTVSVLVQQLGFKEKRRWLLTLSRWTRTIYSSLNKRSHDISKNSTLTKPPAHPKYSETTPRSRLPSEG